MRWIRRLFHGSWPAHGMPDPNIPGNPQTERRGRPAPLIEFSTAPSVLAALSDAISVERAAAFRKCADRQHWGEIGDIELYAISQAEQVISELRNKADAVALSRECHLALELLAQRLRDDQRDVHGYGQGTVYAIKRVLEKPR